MLTADMVPDDVGTRLFHCHVNDHIVAGMLSLYTVTP
jgi:hephaestin